MMNQEAYNSKWSRKIKVYQEYFPGQLIRTYENGAISRQTTTIIERLKNGEDIGV